jgi:type I restriction enzyme S subunit
MEEGRPRGWAVGCIGDIAENLKRGVQPGNINIGTPYIALEHMPRQSISLSDWGVADDLASNKYKFKRGEILFGKLRPYFHKVGVAPIDGVCSTDILVIRAKKSQWCGLVLGHISSRELIDYATALSTGTKMPRTNWHDIARYEIVLPSAELAEKYSELVEQFVQRIQSNIEKSRTLAALRDALLPKLMSGEVRVL